MSQLRVMTILGTRPEIIRLSRVAAALDQYFSHILIHTGQNYDFELNEIFFRDLCIRAPDEFLGAAGNTSVETVANILVKVDDMLVKYQPDAVLVLGDTNSCLAVYAAKRRKIPVFHMEAGNRCRDERVPEEINRRIVDSISDINMPYSERGRDNLVAEGFPVDRIIKTGSPMLEVLLHQLPAVQKSDALDRLGLKKRNYYVISLHREETVDDPSVLSDIVGMINRLAIRDASQIVFSCHPRTSKMLQKNNLMFNEHVMVLKPLGFTDYLKLQTEAIAVLSDSGTISEESAILNFPALNLRESHERMEAMEEGCVIMTGRNENRIIEGLQILKKQKRGEERTVKIPSDYASSNVSEKVARIILSYTGFVNRSVWKKS